MIFSRISTNKNARVLLIAVCGNLLSISFGTYLGWSSPVMPKLREHTGDSPFNFKINIAEEGWITSTISIGSMVAAFIAGPLADRIGRKWSLLASSISIAAGFVLMIFARYISVMYVARFLQGMGGGIGASILSIYIGEIATDTIRGAAGSLMTIFISIGILYVYVIGPYVSYITLQLCCIVFQIVFFIIFCFMPESPYYFAIKGRTKEGVESLQFLRGEKAENVQNEMEQIQKSVQESMKNKGTLADILQNKGNRRAVIICSGLFIFQQSTGASVVTYNSQSIFQSAGSSIDPAVATIILGLVQLATNTVTPFVVEGMGRKVILLISTFGMGLSSFVLGIFFYIQSFGNTSGILWLPLTALVLHTAFFGFGLSPISWAILGEMFATNIKSIASSIVGPITWITCFLVIRFFPELNALGAFYAFWLYAFLCVLAFFFVLFVVIETKGLSLQEIQEKIT